MAGSVPEASHCLLAGPLEGQSGSSNSSASAGISGTCESLPLVVLAPERSMAHYKARDVCKAQAHANSAVAQTMGRDACLWPGCATPRISVSTLHRCAGQGAIHIRR